MKIQLTLALIIISTLFVNAQELPAKIAKAGTYNTMKIPGKPVKPPVELSVGDTIFLNDFLVTQAIWKAKYKGTSILVSDDAITNTWIIDDLRKACVAERRNALMIKKYGKLYGKDIINGTVRLGMSKAMVMEVYGNPSSVNRTGGSWGVHEQWVYESPTKKTEYYYFENGKLTSWQD